MYQYHIGKILILYSTFGTRLMAYHAARCTAMVTGFAKSVVALPTEGNSCDAGGVTSFCSLYEASLPLLVAVPAHVRSDTLIFHAPTLSFQEFR